MKRKIVSIFLIGMLLIISIVPAVYAKSATQRKQELEEQRQDAKDQKAEVTKEKQAVLEEIADLDDEIDKYEDQISELNTKIKNLQNTSVNICGDVVLYYMERKFMGEIKMDLTPLAEALAAGRLPKIKLRISLICSIYVFTPG